jgi:ATP-dependent Clp protease ATP-binding subunit ClpC
VRMYKSRWRQTAKDLTSQLREVRQNHALALEDGRNDDAQDFLERQEAWSAS